MQLILQCKLLQHKLLILLHTDNCIKPSAAQYQPSHNLLYPTVIYDYVNISVIHSLLVETVIMHHL